MAATENIAQWIAIGVSGCIGAASLAWQVVKHRSDRHEAQRQKQLQQAELVEVKGLSFGTHVQYGGYGGLTVRNCGLRPVYLSEVKLEFPIPPQGDALEASGTILFRGDVPHTTPLQPGEGREYRVKLWPWPDLERAIEKGQCWVAVRSHGGEIGRLTSEDVVEPLRKIMELTRRSRDRRSEG